MYQYSLQHILYIIPIIFVSIFPQRYLNRQDANQISYESYVDNEKYSIYVRFWIIIQ